MGADTSDSLRASVVPFNHVVNIGNGARQMAWMDTNAQSRFHGENFENIFIRDRRCDPPPPPPPPKPASAATTWATATAAATAAAMDSTTATASAATRRPDGTDRTCNAACKRV
jgi:hypothetical protein